MMLPVFLLLSTLAAGDRAGRNSSLEEQETQRDLEKREIATGPCDENWFYFPELNSCSRFFSDKRTWLDAEDFCNHHPYYGELASVVSNEHNTFISDLVSSVNKDKPEAWLGLNDRCKEGTFTWIDGSSYSYQNWRWNQPDNYEGIEHCVQIVDGEWNDRPCDDKLGFVCSYKVQSG